MGTSSPAELPGCSTRSKPTLPAFSGAKASDFPEALLVQVDPPLDAEQVCLEVGSLTHPDALELNDAGADGNAHADEDQAADEFTASPGAHADSCAQFQADQRHRDAHRAYDGGGNREADVVGA